MNLDSLDIDSVIAQVQVNSDTIATAVREVGKSNPLYDTRILITGLIAATFTQLLVVIITEWRSWRDLRNKRSLILDDLRSKRVFLVDLLNEYKMLIIKFEARDVDTHQYRAFTELNSDIFNAVSKTDVYKIFKNRIHDIVEIYNMIEFLKAHDVEFTYQDYLSRLAKHTAEKKNDPNHEHFCSTHIQIIERAILNLQKHIVAGNAAIDLIDLQIFK